MKWYRKAAELGNSDAQRRIRRHLDESAFMKKYGISEIQFTHAKRFLGSAGDIKLMGFGDKEPRGWQSLIRTVKMAFEQPYSLSPESRFICNAVVSIDSPIDVIANAAHRYNIDMNADSDTMRDSPSYRLYMKEVKEGLDAVSYVFRAISESLANNGGDISLMTPQQLGRHVHDLREEAQRLRSRAAQPGLNSNQRAAQAAQAQHLEQYMRSISNQAAERNQEEGRKAREKKFKEMEVRKQKYNHLADGSVNPMSNLLYLAFPCFDIDIDSKTGFPSTVQGVDALIKTAGMELGRLSKCPGSPEVRQQIELVKKQQQALAEQRENMTTGAYYNAVMGATNIRALADLARLNPYLASGYGSVARNIVDSGVWPEGSVTKNIQDRLTAMLYYSRDPVQMAIGRLYDNSIKASKMYQQTLSVIESVSRISDNRDAQARRHQKRLDALREMYAQLDSLNQSNMSDADKADIESMMDDLKNQMKHEEEAMNMVTDPMNDAVAYANAKASLEAMHAQNKAYMESSDGGASFDPSDPAYADVKDRFENAMRWLLFVYGNTDFYPQNDAAIRSKIDQYQAAASQSEPAADFHYEMIRKAADQGDAKAQYDLGRMYEEGAEVSQSYSEAAKWFRKAADQGYARAQNWLGVMYEQGKGVPQDYSEAVRWYRKAADQGEVWAQCNLALMYKNGMGVPQDYSEAVKWFRKSADQGHARAQNWLGVMYEQGKGVPQDYSEAVKWFRKAADQGNAYAQCNLGRMYRGGKGIPQYYSEAVKWFNKAAEQGNADAQYNLGQMYREGLGVSQSDKYAAKWYRKAAEQGNADAQYNLGQMYNDGLGVSQNDLQAVSWFQKAADQGHAGAQNSIGLLYEYGKGVSQDYSEAVKWYRKAADQGNANSQYNLGEMCIDGKGISQSDVEAIKWFQMAADQGLDEAKNKLEALLGKKERNTEQSKFNQIFVHLPKEKFLQDPRLIISYMMDFGFERRQVGLLKHVLAQDPRGFKRFFDCSPGSEDDAIATIADYCYVTKEALSEIMYAMKAAMSNDAVPTIIGEFYGEKCIVSDDGNAKYSLDLRTLLDVKNVRSFRIPDSVTLIGDEAFSDCSSLKEIIIPDSVTLIGDEAFSDCSSLKEIIIPDSVTLIGDEAFSDCSSLKEIIIPDSVTLIGDEAFSDCSSLKEIIIPDSVTSIGRWAFSGCSSLKKVVIPDSLTSIGAAIFSGDVQVRVTVSQGNEHFKSVDGCLYSKDGCELNVGYAMVKGGMCRIPDSVSTIGKEAFSGCSSLKEIAIPDSVTTIEDGALGGCSSLKEIVIPDSVTSIGDSVFCYGGCDSLKVIEVPHSLKCKFKYIGSGVKIIRR